MSRMPQVFALCLAYYMSLFKSRQGLMFAGQFDLSLLYYKMISLFDLFPTKYKIGILLFVPQRIIRQGIG